MEGEIVWWEEEQLYVRVVHLGAHASLVRYSLNEMDYEILVANEELDFNITIKTEDDEDD